jgi:hypothetical protein
MGQVLYWVIAASAAAKQDLSPLVEKRWRFLLGPAWPHGCHSLLDHDIRGR